MSPAAYTFPSQLSFSSNNTVGCLVADIPILAIGLVAFAMLSFLLILKKLDLAIIFLSSSALLDFFAGVLDIGQILLRGSVADTSESNSVESALQSTRSIIFSLAAGARFLAFWAIVSQCPRGEIPRAKEEPPASSQTFLSLDSSLHAGNWMRWGIVGILLKWGTVAIAVSIALLQILWRTINTFDNPGVIYAVENGLEIVVSSIFIIKILLNCAIAETITSWQALLQYSPIIFALGINIGIGAGNLTIFPFSESTTGRLLLAIELYFVMETLLIWKFQPSGGGTPKSDYSSNEKRRVSSFQALRISQGNFMRPLSGAATAPIDSTRATQLSRLSASGRRLSSWMIRNTSGLSGRYRPALERDEARLFDPQNVERGRSPSLVSTEQGVTVYDRSPTEPKESARYPDPLFTSFFIDSQRGENAIGPEQNAQSSDVSAAQRGSVAASTVPSYYTGAPDPQAPMVVPPPIAMVQPSSPIFGLNGTIRGGRFSPITLSAGGPAYPVDDTRLSAGSFVPLDPPRIFGADPVSSARSSGYEQLMREQSELEKSIARLRLFASSSMDLSTEPIPAPTDSSPDSESAQRGTIVSSYSTGAPPSASVKSEFSLSNFPEPPLVRKSSQIRPISVQEPTLTASDQKTKERDDDGVIGTEKSGSMDVELLPPRMPAVLQEQTLPTSTRTSEDSAFLAPKSRVDSEGTQYDVTSFIGTLSIPGRTMATSSLAASIKPDEEMSEPMSATSAEIVTIERRPSDGQAARAYRLEGGISRKTNIETAIPQITSGRVAIMPSRSQSTDDIDTSNPVTSPGTSTSPTSSPRVDFARTPNGRAVGLPARPRMIGLPKRQSPLDTNPLAYERPRPAPAFQPSSPF